MPQSILERLRDFERQRPPGRSIPKIVAERLATHFPKIMVGWDGLRKRWCLAAKGRHGVEFLCHIEQGGQYAPLTLRNTVDWLRAGEIARVARSRFEAQRYLKAMEDRRNAQAVAMQREALNRMRDGDRELYKVATGRRVIAFHGRRSNRKNRR